MVINFQTQLITNTTFLLITNLVNVIFPVNVIILINLLSRYIVVPKLKDEVYY